MVKTLARFFLLFACSAQIQAHEVVCSLEDYILTGIEFRKCQQETLQSFTDGNNCKVINLIVESCSRIVKVSYNSQPFISISS